MSSSRDRNHRDRERGDRDRDHRGRHEEEDRKRKERPTEETTSSAPETKRASTTSEPMEIEELIRKKREEEEAAKRPVFMTREQRAAEALQRREQEVAEIKARAEAMRRAAEATIREQRETEERDERERAESTARQREREREREREQRDREREQREREREGAHWRGRKEQEKRPEAASKAAMTVKEIEAEQIRERYLGKQKTEKKFVKASDKFKAARMVDWDPAEDTTKDSAIMFGEMAAVRPMFGRGFLAGIDKSEQMRMFNDSRDTEERKRREVEEARRSSDVREARRHELASELHWTEKRLDQMTERDWRILKEDFSIVARGANIPNPMRMWSESALPQGVLRGIADAGYEKPTAVQMAAIPIGLQFRDLMGIAETGSGKTAAFVIPMFVYISLMPKLTPETEGDGPYALIMAPARELVQQIQDEAVMLAKHTGIRIVSLFGGTSVEDQAFLLRKGCEIVVATPGRLVDMLSSRYLALNQCYYIVLDEADRMIEAGFEQQVNAVLDAMPASNLKSLDEAEAERQEREQGAILAARATAGAAAAADVRSHKVYRTTVMFSATMPPAVERLARKYLRRPAQVQIGNAGRVVDTVEQRVIWTPTEASKRQQLRQALENSEPPIMVFANLKKAVDAITKQLCKEGWRAVALHSSRTQDQRSGAMDGFKEGQYDILVATDVAGRGIDVHGVTMVVNYDMPKKIEHYTHRVGRTGRAGLQGLSVSFLSPEDTEVMYDLRQMLIEKNCPVPPELNSHPAALSRDPKQSKSKDQILATGIKQT